MCTNNTVCLETGTGTMACAGVNVVTTTGAVCNAFGSEPWLPCDFSPRLACEDGLCVAVGDQSPGSKCTTSSDYLELSCDEGTYCDPATLSRVQKLAAGAECSSDRQCTYDCDSESGRCTEISCGLSRLEGEAGISVASAQRTPPCPRFSSGDSRIVTYSSAVISSQSHTVLGVQVQIRLERSQGSTSIAGSQASFVAIPGTQLLTPV